MEIRFLAEHPELVPTIAQWLHREWGYYDPHQTLETKISALSEQLQTNSLPLALVAMVRDQPVGTASLRLDDLPDRPDLSPWLAGVYVVPEHRNKGIASALCKRIAAEASRLGIVQLYLCTEDQENLYRKLGWSVHERLKSRGEDIVVMTNSTVA